MSIFKRTNIISNFGRFCLFHSTPTEYIRRRHNVIKVVPNGRTGCSSRRFLVINKLREILAINNVSAAQIVANNKPLALAGETLLDRNFELCQAEEMTMETLVEFPSILGQKQLERKLKILLDVKEFDLHDTAPLLLMKIVPLRELCSSFRRKYLITKVKYMCDNLSMTKPDVFAAFSRKPFLVVLTLTRMEETLKLMESYGISRNAVVNDLWIFAYNTDTIAHKFECAKSHGIEVLKTWMVRANVEIFERYLNRRNENKNILGDNSLAEYLSDRLDCSPEEINSLIRRMPAIQNKNVKKLQEVIDFLYQEGFMPSHIIRLPKILLHSVETSAKRLRELEKLNVKLDSVHILTKSHKQYMQFYEAQKLKLSKLKSLKNKSL